MSVAYLTQMNYNRNAVVMADGHAPLDLAAGMVRNVLVVQHGEARVLRRLQRLRTRHVTPPQLGHGTAATCSTLRMSGRPLAMLMPSMASWWLRTCGDHQLDAEKQYEL